MLSDHEILRDFLRPIFKGHPWGQPGCMARTVPGGAELYVRWPDRNYETSTLISMHAAVSLYEIRRAVYVAVQELHQASMRAAQVETPDHDARVLWGMG